VETHRGSYTYDGAGRLIQVVDAATNQTEVYTWHADGTLSSFPGPGYVRRLEYDEEGRLIRIRRDFGNGDVQLAYEYGYGFDGGRRWRKDYVNGVWTRYPCGVACGAGDLVEQQKPLEGGSWTTSALYLQGISLVRRNSEWHHFDPFGTAGVITNGSGQVVSNNLYDLFGVLRYEQGSAQTPWRMRNLTQGDEELSWEEGRLLLVSRYLYVNSALPPYQEPRNCWVEYWTCMAGAAAVAAACFTGVGLFFALCISACNALPVPFNVICQRTCIKKAASMAYACMLLWSTMAGTCHGHYLECVRRGGRP
ncbi:MAG: RHS repeat protein, partial [Chthonomonadetes bacterium]|nr:RHS repeat protein [Chthonomonadetes bacterium]